MKSIFCRGMSSSDKVKVAGMSCTTAIAVTYMVCLAATIISDAKNACKLALAQETSKEEGKSDVDQ